MFSVLIELSEATKSWQETLVGTPGKMEKDLVQYSIRYMCVDTRQSNWKTKFSRKRDEWKGGVWKCKMPFSL